MSLKKHLTIIAALENKYAPNLPEKNKQSIVTTCKEEKIIDLKSIPSTKEDLDSYDVENVFHSWCYQPSQAPLRVVSAKGTRFTTEDGRERLDFSSCFVSHNIGHQNPRVVEAICNQAKTLCSFAPVFSTKPRAVLAKMLEEITPGDLSRSFLTLGGTVARKFLA